jgi:hypothetical protein
MGGAEFDAAVLEHLDIENPDLFRPDPVDVVD